MAHKKKTIRHPMSLFIPTKVLVPDRRKVPTGEDIIKAVSIYFGCSVKEMKADCRKERLKLGSFATAYLCWTWTEMSLKQIADLMDYYNHSSVIHARDVIFEQLEPKVRNFDMQYRIGLVEDYLGSRFFKVKRKEYFTDKSYFKAKTAAKAPKKTVNP